MKLFKILLCLLAGICLFVSCQGAKTYPEAMQQAERCIAEHPDSALVYLSSLDSLLLNEPLETRMYHELLTVKAKDKLYIPHTSDSLIKQVAHFYESYGDADKLMEAYYYLGSVYRDMKDVPRAIVAFQKAAEKGKNSLRYDILGRIYERIGTLFAYQSLYEDALEAYKKSFVYYRQQKEETGILYALRNQARIHESLRQIDSTEYYYGAAYRKAFEMKKPELIISISEELANVYLDLGKPDSAKKVFSRIAEQKNDAVYLFGLARLYDATLQSDSAQLYYQEAVNEGKYYQNIYLQNSVYEALANIEAQKNNYRQAFGYAQQSLHLKDSIRKITRTEAIGKIHELYNYRHTEKENQQLWVENERKRHQNHLWIICFLSLTGLAALAIQHVRRQKRIALEKEKRLAQLKEEQYKSSLASIKENEKKIAALELLLQQSEVQKNTLQNQLITFQKELLELSNRKIQIVQNEKDLLIVSLRKSDIYKLFHQAVKQDKVSITQDNWKALQQIIDTTYPDFVNHLYSVCPQISDQELRMCYLIKIQIQVRGIAQILNRTTSAITNSRIRLYKKIYGTQGKAEDLDKFILDL